MAYEEYGDKLKNKIAGKVAEKAAPVVSKKFGDKVSEEDFREVISDGTKTSLDLATGTKNFDEATTYAKDKTRSKIADKVTKEIAPPVSRELVKFSDAALERSYKVSYELAEVTLPPRISKELTRDLRISTNRLKKANADNLNAAAVEIVSSSTKTIFDFATGEKNFDEASRAIATQTKVVVKKVVVEKGKEIAIQEAKRIGGNAAQKVLLNVGINSNVAAKALVFGSMIKDNVLDLLDGKIDEEQFIKEVGKKGLTLAIETVGGFVGAEIGATYGAVIGQTLIPIPVVGAVIGSTVTAVACSGLIVAVDATLKLWDASKVNAAADRRKIISKIKTDALAEMEHQRGVMKKYFADEKYKWDKNVQDGFELISKGTYSNDVEIIAKGLDKILQNFGGQVAFSSYKEFDDFFMDDNSVLKL